MVKIDLNYNPYLPETTVLFNGQKPRINSRVEQYLSEKIQEWIDEMPEIFHDEMNGYGFELIYSGTKDDYNRIKEAFSKKGVTEDEVKFFFKNELDPAAKKNQLLHELLTWLDSNRNARFNFDDFKAENENVLVASYSFLMINGLNARTVEIFGEKVSLENVTEISEIKNTDLTETPIVIFFTPESEKSSREFLDFLKRKDDVKDNQLFFCISRDLNKAQIERVIIDYGISNPTIIEKLDDEHINKYFEIYSLTNHVKNVLDVFRNEIYRIQSELDDANEKLKNSEIYNQINSIDNDISRLKDSDELFVQRDNLSMPNEFSDILNTFSEQIMGWRKKKTKTIDAGEAEKMAIDFDSDLEKIVQKSIEAIKRATELKKIEIDNTFNQWFRNANVDSEYNPKVMFSGTMDELELKPLHDEFMELKTEQMVDAKTDFFSRLRGNADKQEKVLEVTYSYEIWRNKAYCTISPIIKDLENKMFSALSHYYDDLSALYHSHIEELLCGKESEKEIKSQKLSDDEKILQVDNDWFAELKDKIHLIERG